ncbi:MAG: flagellar biosynthesis anti-sigma factor FlgM [Planctomycetaceae bacterium]|jgi:anti-sigma28 factor (negative regulator of flagellin synthesis)|nr:flagellar biosynthesis anti-sigma factor FlgM [Planctomycetaceae bacterium]
MNTINPQHIASLQNLQGLTRSTSEHNLSQTVNAPLPVKDSVSFSAEALKLSGTVSAETSATSKVRFDLVNRIKAEIAAGTYDTPDKMDAAVEKMTARIFS